MGELFTRLTQLLNFSNTIAVTVPGLIAAAALVIGLQPRPSRDFIYVEKPGQPCQFDQPQDLEPEPFSLRGRSDHIIQNLKRLEEVRDRLQQCILTKTRDVGADEGLIATKNEEIAVRLRERGAYEKKYLAYVESRGALRGEYEKGFDDLNTRIQGLRDEVVDKQKTSRQNQLWVDRLKARLELVKERIGDPTRARPAAGVTEFFDSLTAKVAAFALLAMVLGFALDPINRGFFGFVFDRYGRTLFNSLRPDRFYVVS